MRILAVIGFCFFYWGVCAVCTGTDRKNLAGLRSYPDAVQRAVREHPVLGKIAPEEKPLPSILLGNLILFSVVFSALGLALKARLGLAGFADAFAFFLLLGEGLGVFDLLVIDLLWWRNGKRVRFSFLPEKAAYQDAAKHVASFWRGVPLFAAVAAMFPMGGATVVAIRMGRGDKEGANHAFMTALSITFALSVLLTIAGMAFARPIVDWSGAKGPGDEMREMSARYLFYYCAFSVPMLMSTCLSVLERNDGSPVLSFAGMCVGARANIFWIGCSFFRCIWA